MAAKSEPAVLEQAVASLDTTSEEVNPNDHGV
jgi:hypothetical protein